MSLSPGLRDIYGSYEFCEEERRHLTDYYTETKKQLERELLHDEVETADLVSKTVPPTKCVIKKGAKYVGK